MTATGNWMARLGCAAAAIALSLTVNASEALAAEAKGEPIEIPFLQTFSGAAAGYGEVMMNGAVLGVEIVNKQLGGVKGRPIKLIPSDAPFTDMPAAVTMFKKLARNPKVPALLGISATSILAAVHDQIEQFKIPVFAYDSGGHWRLGKFNPYVWRIIPMAPVGVPVVMSKMQKKFNIKKAALMFNNDDEAAAANAIVYRKVAKDLGIELIEGSAKVGEPDWSAQLTKSKGAGIDAFFLVAQAFDSGLLIKQAREMGMNQPAIADLVAQGPDYWKMSQGKVGTTVTWAFFSHDDKRAYVQNLYKAFWKMHNREPDQWEMLAADGVIILAKMMNKAKDLSRESIREAFASTKAVDSIIGSIGWDGSGDALNKKVILVKWTDKGTTELVPESFWSN